MSGYAALFAPALWVRKKIQPSVYSGQLRYQVHEISYALPEVCWCPMLGRNAKGIRWGLDGNLNIVRDSIRIY